eukprot:TRINITY_DN1356_c0_g1_i2.p1 TRINITY_DN1356_c0_g1~~TRINITY_DN1356_c0_g1_i2.p1  ORF type:complete len:295 (-),score=109.99 TRINITY_DN1356_c0_g1_i2:50-934(-)
MEVASGVASATVPAEPAAPAANRRVPPEPAVDAVDNLDDDASGDSSSDNDWQQQQQQADDDASQLMTILDGAFLPDPCPPPACPPRGSCGDQGAISTEQLMQQRHDKIGRLLTLYKAQFHRLKDALRARHRRFIQARQQLARDGPDAVRMAAAAAAAGKPRERRKQQQQHAAATAADDGDKKRPCAFIGGCSGRAMLLTTYCYAHILCDPRQQLFTNCAYVSSSHHPQPQAQHQAPQPCRYPIIVGQSPPYCCGHVDLVVAAKDKPVRSEPTRPQACPSPVACTLLDRVSPSCH